LKAITRSLSALCVIFLASVCDGSCSATGFVPYRSGTSVLPQPTLPVEDSKPGEMAELYAQIEKDELERLKHWAQDLKKLLDAKMPAKASEAAKLLLEALENVAHEQKKVSWQLLNHVFGPCYGFMKKLAFIWQDTVWGHIPCMQTEMAKQSRECRQQRDTVETTMRSVEHLMTQVKTLTQNMVRHDLNDMKLLVPDWVDEVQRTEDNQRDQTLVEKLLKDTGRLIGELCESKLLKEKWRLTNIAEATQEQVKELKQVQTLLDLKNKPSQETQEQAKKILEDWTNETGSRGNDSASLVAAFFVAVSSMVGLVLFHQFRARKPC